MSAERPRQDLYGLPLERFIDERNVLSKTLRKMGSRDEAGKVAKLHKPSVAAWAVNQLVRTQRSAVAALFDAGDSLQKIQSDLIVGRGDGEALRRAVDAERSAVGELTEKARGLLSSDGHELSPTTLERVSETLHAAALDQEARAKVRDGRLERELRHIGLGAIGASLGSSGEAAAGRRRSTAPKRIGSGKNDRDRVAKREPDRSAREARGRELEARRSLRRAARELEVAENRRARAADELVAAEEALAVARDRAAQAEKAHQAASKSLQDV